MRRLFRIVLGMAVAYALAGCVIVLPSQSVPNGDMSISPMSTVTPSWTPQARTPTPVASPGQPAVYKIPDVTGLTEFDARGQLSRYFTNVTTQQVQSEYVDAVAGTVVRMEPAPGTMATTNQQITLYISSGDVVLPAELIGASRDEALRMLSQRGIDSANVNYQYQDTLTMTPDCVMNVDPPTGSLVSRDTKITLYIARPIPPASSPSPATYSYPSSTPTSR